MHAEADQADRGERHEAEHSTTRDAQSLARARSREHEEGQHETRCELHAHACDQCAGGGAKARAPACAQQQGEPERQQDERVVMRAADRQHQQHRVQPDEGSRAVRRVPETRRRPRDQRHRAEARGDRHRFQQPQAAGEAQRSGHIARKREQRAVGGMLEWPSDEPEDSVRGSFGGHVRVRVQAVQSAHPRKGQIAEGVLREQRWPERQDHVCEQDRCGDRAKRQRARH
jgi:hypothetical protein